MAPARPRSSPKTTPSAAPRRRWRPGPVFWICLTVALVVAGVWAWRQQRDYLTTMRFLPADGPPANVDVGLAGRWQRASARAGSWGRARAGLAELSRLAHANARYDDALRCYEGLMEMEPGEARWPHLRAAILMSFGRLDEALPLRERAVALAPDYLPARLRLGDLLVKTNRLPAAVAAYNEVLRRDQTEPYARLGLARCALAAGDWRGADAQLRTVLAGQPDFAGALSLHVTVSEHLGNRADAEAARTAMSDRIFTDLPDPWFDALLDDCFDAYLLSVAAAARNFAGDRRATLALIDRAIELAPGVSSYRRQAGQYLLQQQDFRGARDRLARAVELNPADAENWQRYLDALEGLGLRQDYATALQRGLAACPQSSGLRLQHARWLRANNRPEEAIREFRASYELRPSEAGPLIEIATIQLEAGRLNEAEKTLHLALERQPDHPSALATLAHLGILMQNEPEARRWLVQLGRQARVPAALLQQLRESFGRQFGKNPP